MSLPVEVKLAKLVAFPQPPHQHLPLVSPEMPLLPQCPPQGPTILRILSDSAQMGLGCAFLISDSQSLATSPRGDSPATV